MPRLTEQEQQAIIRYLEADKTIILGKRNN